VSSVSRASAAAAAAVQAWLAARQRCEQRSSPPLAAKRHFSFTNNNNSSSDRAHLQRQRQRIIPVPLPVLATFALPPHPPPSSVLSDKLCRFTSVFYSIQTTTIATQLLPLQQQLQQQTQIYQNKGLCRSADITLSLSLSLSLCVCGGV